MTATPPVTTSPWARTTARLLGLVIGALLAISLLTSPAAAETTECGNNVGGLDLSSQSAADGLDQEADLFYDPGVAALHRQLGWMSREDFCSTVRWLIGTSAAWVVDHGIKTAIAGRTLSGDEQKAFEAAWYAAKANNAAADPSELPDQIPAVGPESAATTSFTVQDVHLGGTWARSDPNDGSWYSSDNQPANGSWWYVDGLGVAVDCARVGAPYAVHFADRVETWSTWFHVTDGQWIPAAALVETTSDGDHGLPTC